ncbi:inactive peptidyl-prolyl cis-trans isomerase FKBP6 [Adelges cooleyi]|uniref:inactive peptidyl-prolyl cis-trans isomerase FKBP6 n=1 Tax=Adelges cooleyi TaxID=133065 RepID=UPI00217F4383|nr:inactive peptidyl-prolyl cis-trans isomerase FKBP6 [Adelges cooleyi]
MADFMLPPDIENTLKNAAEQLVQGRTDYSFSVEPNMDNPEDNFFRSYDQKEVSEFLNFSLLGEEGKNIEPFAELASRMTDITGDRKVLKEITEEGVGQIVPEDSIVMVHYIAHFENIVEPFDVTYLHGKRPHRYTLSTGELLPGLEIAIKTMRKGEHARFLIHPDLAYKELGCPPRIPANATIHFEVDLVNYYSQEQSLAFDEDARDPNRYDKVLNKAKKYHTEGNDLFKLKNVERATVKYNKAKELLHIITTHSEAEETEVMKYLCKLYTNLCICYLKQCAFSKVCCMAREARQYADRYSKHNAKLHYTWGKALRLLKSFADAKEKLLHAQKIKPNDVQIRDELQKLEKDKEFNTNIEFFTLKKHGVNTEKEFNQMLPPEFWDIFNQHLEEFNNGVDDIFTVSIAHPDDIKLVKRKASLFDLEVQIIDSEDEKQNCLIMKKP